MSLEQALLAAVTTLAGAVVYLFRLVHANYTECAADRRALYHEVAQLKHQLAGVRHPELCDSIGDSDADTRAGKR